MAKALWHLAGVGLATLGTLLLGLARLPVAPDLFLMPVASAARGGAPILAMLVGLVGGLLEDQLFDPGRLLGLHAFTKVLVGYLLGTLGVRTIVEKPLAVGGLLSGAVLLENAALLLLLWLLRGTFLAPNPMALAARAATTGVLGAALHALALVPWRERRDARRRRRLSS